MASRAEVLLACARVYFEFRTRGLGRRHEMLERRHSLHIQLEELDQTERSSVM
jgi:hypothetical protein